MSTCAVEPVFVPGDVVRVREGFCGEGHKFLVDSVIEAQVYGRTWAGSVYGPVRLSEVELVERAAARREKVGS